MSSRSITLEEGQKFELVNCEGQKLGTFVFDRGTKEGHLYLWQVSDKTGLIESLLVEIEEVE